MSDSATKTRPREGGADDRDPEERAVMRVLGRFARAFDSRDIETFMSVWDPAIERPVYQAEELLEPRIGTEGLRAYFEHVPEVVSNIGDVRIVESHVEVLGDAAYVYLRFWCRLSMAKQPRTVDGQVRQTYVLRRRDDEWKLVHYHESRQSPGFEEAVGAW